MFSSSHVLTRRAGTLLYRSTKDVTSSDKSHVNGESELPGASTAEAPEAMQSEVSQIHSDSPVSMKNLNMSSIILESKK